MRSGLDPQSHEQAKTLKTPKQLRAANFGIMDVAEGVDRLLKELVLKLGGPNAVLEQLSSALEAQGSVECVTEDSPGYCYLRLFDRVEHRDAALMGVCPTAAELRRFSNGRSDPFGNRSVIVKIHATDGERIGHIMFDGGVSGLRPVAALAALSKDLRVGLPDGVSEDFPPDWIPHDKQIIQTWDYIANGTIRSLDLLGWVGDLPSWLDNKFEPISNPTSKVRWVLKANPLGPPTGLIDVIDPRGKVISAREWTSYVAHTGYHQDWRVRGTRIFAEAHVWRAARVLTDPSAPTPTPPPDKGHGELFDSVGPFQSVERRPAWGSGASVTLLPSATADTEGFCYARAFSDQVDAIATLGLCPTVRDIIAYSKEKGGLDLSSTVSPRSVSLSGDRKLFHVLPAGVEGGEKFWDCVHTLSPMDKVGATQAETVRGGAMENTSAAPTLAIRPKGPGTLMTVPFVAVLGTGKELLFWDVSAGKKFATLSSYFESVEMVSLKIRVTVHKGDNSTLVTIVADSSDTFLQTDADWVGAAHTLYVSGNVNGATSGELVLEGNHGFGVQLKGVTVGNPTPIIQAKLETSVAATAFVKLILTVRVAGTGIPVAMVLPTKPAKGGFNGLLRGGPNSEED